jgi:hypothetical protein
MISTRARARARRHCLGLSSASDLDRSRLPRFIKLAATGTRPIEVIRGQRGMASSPVSVLAHHVRRDGPFV